MKPIFLIPLMIISNISFAQIVNPKETVKRKSTERANGAIDRTIDKGLDKVEEGVISIFKKKTSNESEANEEENTTSKKKTQPKTTENSEESSSEPTPNSNKNQANQPTGGSFKSYSKFDFIAGEKVIYFDDFERVDVGDFPLDFNTNASGEVMTVEGKEGKWLGMTKNGTFIPEGIKALPDNFTLEFNVGILEEPSNNLYGFGLLFGTNPKELMSSSFGSFVYLHPSGKQGSANFLVNPENGEKMENQFMMPQWNTDSKAFAKISISRQKGRLRLYVNESKIMDIPRFFIEPKSYHFAFYRDFFYDCNLLVSNIKFAVGNPDTRNKLISEGKFVTRGILFDVNSAQIKPESYGILKEISTVLKDNPSVRIKIIGHTDSDGDNTKNLELSKRRAASVKNSLETEFGIEQSRMETDGKGESEPSEPNTSAQSKANNRRVEFIKL